MKIVIPVAVKHFQKNVIFATCREKPTKGLTKKQVKRNVGVFINKK